MTPPPQCPRCGTALATDAPEGLCPACLMEKGLEIPSTDEGQDPDSAATTRAAAPSEAAEERVIGPYRLMQKLGEGGMGEVWLAEQQEPVRRKVALKIIKRGMDSKQVVSRFEAERQALALMEHPSIARVFDAGTTPRGRPYFVMEHVRGIPITNHCDRNRLSTRERLDLFQQVCTGVQHAHQKGIIHRDLKPSNVLVAIQDGEAVPKIIDFGVAKATEHRLTEHSVFTELGVLIGTPEYMSPEQADLTAQDIDTRTDVYSLGVLLYELLAGALPFDSRELREAGFDEIRRKIREEDPPKPSTRLSTLGGEETTEAAKARRTDAISLRRQLTGDLDWITMRALEKDRTRRYASPNELAADVGRHLADEPVLAGPPSAAYRTRKFMRRHRLGVAFAAVLAFVLIGFAVTMAVQARRIANERDRANLEAERANREANTANEVSTFMVRLFEIPDPGEARGNEVTAREILDKGVKQIERGLKDEPLTKATLMHTMGKTYRGLGIIDGANSLLTQALALREAHPEVDSRDLASTLFDLGLLVFFREQRSGDFTEVRRYWERGLAIQREALAPDDPELALTLTGLGNVAWGEGSPADAERLYREAQAIHQRNPESDWREAINEILLAVTIRSDEDKQDEALALVGKALETYERVHREGEYWDPLVETLSLAAEVYIATGDLNTAIDLFKQEVDLRETELGPEHPALGRSLMKSSKMLLRLGDIEGAYEYRRRVMEIREADPDTAPIMLVGGRLQLAHLLMKLGRPAEARVHYRGAIDLLTEDVVNSLGRESTVGVQALNELAVLVGEAGEHEDALRIFEYAVLCARRCQELNQCPTLETAIHRDWAELLRRMDRDAEAAEHEALAAGN